VANRLGHAGAVQPERYGGAGKHRRFALAAAVWHNWNIQAETKRNLTAYDH
jgi:hypothetical protein